ncbi:uncharacterized protein LOC142586292 [Dermacentor variabilis]|uniref:uncharacterized protein LOC142586292 n=1 Tax=Dermacentor variabilis TaxID=34621 RepID=UPI003F5B435F
MTNPTELISLSRRLLCNGRFYNLSTVFHHKACATTTDIIAPRLIDVFHPVRRPRDTLRRLQSALLVPDVISTPQIVLVPGDEALCITLRHLSYPNRLCELEQLFGRHYSVISSVTSYVLSHIEDKFVHLLKDVNNHTWVDLPTIDMFAQAIHSKGAPLHNCWGCIDGTARAICRPSTSQKVFFSGHKRVHSVKYQSIMCPNGIICQLSGPFFGSRHDAGILRKSKTYEKLEKLVQGHNYCLYGDPA